MGMKSAEKHIKKPPAELGGGVFLFTSEADQKIAADFN